MLGYEWCPAVVLTPPPEEAERFIQFVRDNLDATNRFKPGEAYEFFDDGYDDDTCMMLRYFPGEDRPHLQVANIEYCYNHSQFYDNFARQDLLYCSVGYFIENYDSSVAKVTVDVSEFL